MKKCIEIEILYSNLKTLHTLNKKIITHSSRVSHLAYEFGNHLGLSTQDKKRLFIGGFLHDIGKNTFDKDLLESENPLTKDRRDKIYNHTLIGYSLINDGIQDQTIKEIVLFHHERVDGTGYPYQLYGYEIPYLAKIISICDAYDAMVSGRSYKEAITPEEAIDELIHNAGTQFDYVLVSKFIDFMQVLAIPTTIDFGTIAEY